MLTCQKAILQFLSTWYGTCLAVYSTWVLTAFFKVFSLNDGKGQLFIVQVILILLNFKNIYIIFNRSGKWVEFRKNFRLWFPQYQTGRLFTNLNLRLLSILQKNYIMLAGISNVILYWFVLLNIFECEKFLSELEPGFVVWLATIPDTPATQPPTNKY